MEVTKRDRLFLKLISTIVNAPKGIHLKAARSAGMEKGEALLIRSGERCRRDNEKSHQKLTALIEAYEQLTD